MYCNTCIYKYKYLLGTIDVKHMSSSIMPVRNRGRPRNAAKALVNDESIDVMALRPGDWKNATVRHSEYLNGMCVDFRLEPNDKNKKIVRWQCHFPDAPDTLLAPPKIVGFYAPEMKAALELYRTWMRNTAQINFECEDEI
jgi:hypothetical protein